jgi:hypothetical protein
MSLIVTTEYDFQRVEPPALPYATEQYNKAYQDQLNNVLRLYFNRLNNILNQLNTGSGSIDGSGLRLPYGAFSSNQIQTTTANTATLMTLNTTDFSNDVGLVIGSKMKATVPGIYNLQFSTQFQNTDNQIQDISIWLRQGNGGGASADIPGSTGFVSIPARKSASAGEEAHEIIGWNYYVSMAADDYIQIYWSATNASVTIHAYSASTGPVRPSTASVVATMTFVSALP